LDLDIFARSWSDLDITPFENLIWFWLRSRQPLDGVEQLEKGLRDAEAMASLFWRVERDPFYEDMHVIPDAATETSEERGGSCAALLSL